MNLTLKIIIYYLLIAIVVFSIGGVVTYRLISHEIAKETDYYLARSLDIIEYRLERAVKRGYNLENKFNTSQVTIKEIPSMPLDKSISFSDTLAMHPHLKQLEMMRKLSVAKEIAGKAFEITMIDVIIEDSDIYESVVGIIIRLFAIFALVMIAGTFLMSRSLLKPFRETLHRIKKFKVQDPAPPKFPKTSTLEFKQLNELLGEMTAKAQSEYQVLKKFSENASHEMQTPLAIASGKLDILTDGEGLTEEQFSLILSTQRSLKKLSHLGKSLSLLTKIENGEFVSSATNVSDLVHEAMDNFKELFEIRELKVKSAIEDDVVIGLNPHLGTILLNNLLQNAIRHNVDQGSIDVVLDARHLQVSNTGAEPKVPTERLFDRFEKDAANNDSSGLGLAIVKEICDLHNMKINYVYNGRHEINIHF